MIAVAAPTSEDALLGGKLTLRQPLRGHRFGHDAVLLAAAAPAPPGEHAIQTGARLGAGGWGRPGWRWLAGWKVWRSRSSNWMRLSRRFPAKPRRAMRSPIACGCFVLMLRRRSHNSPIPALLPTPPIMC